MSWISIYSTSHLGFSCEGDENNIWQRTFWASSLSCAKLKGSFTNLTSVQLQKCHAANSDVIHKIFCIQVYCSVICQRRANKAKRKWNCARSVHMSQSKQLLSAALSFTVHPRCSHCTACSPSATHCRCSLFHSPLSTSLCLSFSHKSHLRPCECANAPNRQINLVQKYLKVYLLSGCMCICVSVCVCVCVWWN